MDYEKLNPIGGWRSIHVKPWTVGPWPASTYPAAGTSGTWPVGGRAESDEIRRGGRHAWECPRCHRINTPHVDQCTCEPPQTD